MHPVQPSFQVYIEGNFPSALYDCRFAESIVVLGVCKTTVSVETSPGESFTCAIKLNILDSISHHFNIILGRDCQRFQTCSTGLEARDNPEVVLCLSSLNKWLVFAALPDNVISLVSDICSDEQHELSFEKKICYVSGHSLEGDLLILFPFLERIHSSSNSLNHPLDPLKWELIPNPLYFTLD